MRHIISNEEILSFAVDIGACMLKSGGEIYRVQETIEHILASFNIHDYHVYVLSNGIFANTDEKENNNSVVRYVTLGSTHLGKVAALN